MVWDNPFDYNIDLCVETEEGDTIYLMVNGKNIGFNSRALTEDELQFLSHVHLMSKFQWNPKTVHLGEVRADALRQII